MNRRMTDKTTRAMRLIYTCRPSEAFLIFTLFASLCCFIPFFSRGVFSGDIHNFRPSEEQYWSFYRLTLIVAVSTSLPMSLDTVLDYQLPVRSLIPRWFIVLALTVPNIVAYIALDSLSEGSVAIAVCSVAMRETLLRGTLLSFLLHDGCSRDTACAVSCVGFMSAFAMQTTLWEGFAESVIHPVWVIFARFVDGVSTTIVIAMLVQRYFEAKRKEESCVYKTVYATLYVINYILKCLVIVSVADITYIGISDILICILATTIPGRQARHEKSLAEHMINSKRDFVSYMSHEIRTPLNTIYMGIQLLYKEYSSIPSEGDDVKNILEDINSSCRVAIDILNEFLMANRIEAGNLSLNITEILAVDLIESVTAPFDVQARQQGVNYVHSGDTHIDPTLRHLNVMLNVDVKKISQVLRNLISNALKFTSSGDNVDVYAFLAPKATPSAPIFSFQSKTMVRPETLRASREYVLSRDSADSNTFTVADLKDCVLRVEVHDSGVGIKEEDRKRLFKDIVHFGQSHLHNGGGSGLGLWISKGIIELHAGRMGVMSELGMGSMFFFEIRLASHNDTLQKTGATADEISLRTRVADVSIEQSTLLHQGSIPQGSSQPKVKRVLVVDDSAVSRKMVCRLLGNRVIEKVQAENGLIAVAKVQESIDMNCPFDVIVMDATMPEMGGAEATSRIRKLGFTGFIVFLTGNAMPEERARFIASGADDVIIKPCTLDAILKILSTVLLKSRPISSAVHITTNLRKDLSICSEASSEYSNTSKINHHLDDDSEYSSCAAVQDENYVIDCLKGVQMNDVADIDSLV